jgi:hypothetical protein
VTQYRIQLPDGWWRVRLTSDPEREAGRLVDRTNPPSRSGDDPDTVLARRKVKAELASSFRAAAEVGGVDLYSFEGVVEGERLPMTFGISVLYLGPTLAAMPLETVAEGLFGDRDHQVVRFPAGSMIRSLEVTTAPARDRVPQDDVLSDPPLSASTRAMVADLERIVAHQGDVLVERTVVDYVTPIPDEPGTFVLASLSAPGPHRIAERVAHFDLLMAGFGWTT